EDRDGLLDGCAPGGCGERPHDARRAEDGDAADDAESAIGGLARHDLATRNGNDDTYATYFTRSANATDSTHILIAAYFTRSANAADSAHAVIATRFAHSAPGVQFAHFSRRTFIVARLIRG